MISWFVNLLEIRTDSSVNDIFLGLYNPKSTSCGSLSQCSGELFWIGDNSTYEKPAWMNDKEIKRSQLPHFIWSNSQLVFYGLSSTEARNALCRTEEENCRLGKLFPTPCFSYRVMSCIHIPF